MSVIKVSALVDPGRPVGRSVSLSVSKRSYDILVNIRFSMRQAMCSMIFQHPALTNNHCYNITRKKDKTKTACILLQYVT